MKWARRSMPPTVWPHHDRTTKHPVIYSNDTERHLLYVACTRARDHLLVTSVEPASEFLDDLRSA
jgi:superfamily I DNA/RNA helicase